MIRTLAVNSALILVCSKDDRNTVVEKASNEMVMGSVQELCEYSLLVSQQTNSDLSLTALDDALKWFYQNKGILREQNIPMSAKAQVDDLLAMESQQLCKQMINKICAAMAALVYGAENVSTTKRRQFQVCLNGP